MTWILDTNVVSELARVRPDPGVEAWFRARSSGELFLSAVTVGEIARGIAAAPSPERQRNLQIWLEQDILAKFAGRILESDTDIFLLWGRWMAEGAKAGQPRPILDTLIAATAYTHQLTLVTRNVSDFPLEVATLNPWT